MMSLPAVEVIRRNTSQRHCPLYLTLGLVLALGAVGLGMPGAAMAQAETAGQVIMITGSTDGLGREVALELAGPGTHIIIHGRNQERGMEVVRQVVEAGGTARFYQADLASLDQVRTLASAILRDYDRLDVLVNNAGIWLTPEQGRQVSVDGHEMHFAVNYLSHYLLTRQLLPLLVASAPSRIVNVASAAQQPIDFDNVNLEQGYSDGRAYSQSKLAQILFTLDLAEELRDSGVRVNALHPATMMNTSMVLSRGATSRSSVEEGVAAVLHLIQSPEVGSGEYYNGTQLARPNAQALDATARERLRQLSDRLTGRG